jgi:hypothetical protein
MSKYFDKYETSFNCTLCPVFHGMAKVRQKLAASKETMHKFDVEGLISKY